ncbi:UNKNOWN [Stylonychia lemnae]|uniref:Novel STAND NTPase 1 domain-containing protein n=1 Tax=Stylonychia lemnae TaxID=5949 RepID=A0A078A804_STYLE|nr:UNKNOWN [Stylonychia lemnae]|eukprot:CDW76896.1 UNKNOWN [Stylonychia lemnae]
MRPASYRAFQPGHFKGDNDDIEEPRLTIILPEQDSLTVRKGGQTLLPLRLDDTILDVSGDFSDCSKSENGGKHPENYEEDSNKSNQASFFEKSQHKNSMVLNVEEYQYKDPIKIYNMEQLFELFGYEKKFVYKNSVYQLDVTLSEDPESDTNEEVKAQLTRTNETMENIARITQNNNGNSNNHTNNDDTHQIETLNMLSDQLQDQQILLEVEQNQSDDQELIVVYSDTQPKITILQTDHQDNNMTQENESSQMISMNNVAEQIQQKQNHIQIVKDTYYEDQNEEENSITEEEWENLKRQHLQLMNSSNLMGQQSPKSYLSMSPPLQNDSIKESKSKDKKQKNEGSSILQEFLLEDEDEEQMQPLSSKDDPNQKDTNHLEVFSQITKMHKENLSLIEQLREAKKQLEKMNQRLLSTQLANKLQQQTHFAYMFAQPLVLASTRFKIKFEMEQIMDFNKEFNEIKSTLSKTNREIKAKFRQCTLINFAAILSQKPISLHFSGYGVDNSYSSFVGSPGSKIINEEDYLLFETDDGLGELVSEKTIQALIKSSNANLEFVFVASNQSEIAANIFLNAGAKHAICIRQGEKISESALIAFLKLFYNLVFNQSMNICESFKLAQKKIEVIYGLSESLKFNILVRQENENLDLNDNNGRNSSLQFYENSQIKTGSHQCKIFGPLKKGKLDHQEIQVRFNNLKPVNESLKARQRDMHETVSEIINNRLVTILGLPGVGKSSLLKSTCQYLMERNTFQAGILYLSLKGYQNQGLILRKFQSAFLKQELKDKSQTDNSYLEMNSVQIFTKIMESLMILEQELLIVFDNTEEIMYHDKSKYRSFLSELLNASSYVKIVLTSRSTLGDIQEIKEKVQVINEISTSNFIKLYLSKAKTVPIEEIQELLSYTSQENIENLSQEQIVKMLGEHQLFKIICGIPSSALILAKLNQKLTLKQIYNLSVSREVKQVVSSDGIKNNSLLGLRILVEIIINHIDNEDPKTVQFFFLIGQLPGGIKDKELQKIWGSDYTIHLNTLKDYGIIEVLQNPNTGRLKISLSPFIQTYASSKISKNDRIYFSNELSYFYDKLLKKIFEINHKSRKHYDKRAQRDYLLRVQMLKHECNVQALIMRMIDQPTLKRRSLSKCEAFQNLHNSPDKDSRTMSKIEDEISIQLSEINPREAEELCLIDNVVKDAFIQFSKPDYDHHFMSLIQLMKDCQLQNILSSNKKRYHRKQGLWRSFQESTPSRFLNNSNSNTDTQEESLHYIERLVITYCLNLYLFDEIDIAKQFIENQAMFVDGNGLFKANIYKVAGLVYFRCDEAKKAQFAFDKSKKLYRDLDNTHGVALTRFALNYIAKMQLDDLKTITAQQNRQACRLWGKFTKILENFQKVDHIVGQALTHQCLSQLFKIQFTAKKNAPDLEQLQYDFLEHQEQYQKLLQDFQNYQNKAYCPHIRRVQGPEISLIMELVKTNESTNLFPPFNKNHSDMDQNYSNEESLLILDDMDDESAYTMDPRSPNDNSQNFLSPSTIRHHTTNEEERKIYSGSKIIIESLEDEDLLQDETAKTFSPSLLKSDRNSNLTNTRNTGDGQFNDGNSNNKSEDEVRFEDKTSKDLENSNNDDPNCLVPPKYFTSNSRRSMKMSPLEVVEEETEYSFIEQIDKKDPKPRYSMQKLPHTTKMKQYLESNSQPGKIKLRHSLTDRKVQRPKSSHGTVGSAQKVVKVKSQNSFHK